MKNRTYDNELTLIMLTYTADAIGNQIPEKVESVVLCCVDSAGRSDFYAAATDDLRPELVFTVHDYEYSGEKTVRFRGEEYSVFRTYSVGTEEVELSVRRAVANGKNH